MNEVKPFGTIALLFIVGGLLAAIGSVDAGLVVIVLAFVALYAAIRY